MKKRSRSDQEVLDPVILKNLTDLAEITQKPFAEIYAETPWAVLLPDAVEELSRPSVAVHPAKVRRDSASTSLASFVKPKTSRVTELPPIPELRTWLYLGHSELECASNTRGAPNWQPGCQLECDMSITYPRFLSKRSLRVNGRSVITTGALLRVTLATDKPEPIAVLEPERLLEQCSNRLRRHSAATHPEMLSPKKLSKSAAPKKPLVTTLEDNLALKGLSFEGYVASQLASERPEDLMSCVLLLIAPLKRFVPGGALKKTEFVGSSSFGNFSGNAFVRVMYEGRDLGKLEADVTNILAVLLALKLAHVSFRLSDSIAPTLQLGTIFKVRADVWLSPLAFQQSAFVEALIGEAQAVLRNAMMGLFSRLLKWRPTRASILWSLTRSDGIEAIESSVDDSLTTSSPQEDSTEVHEEELDEDELQRKNNEVFGTGTLTGGTTEIHPDRNVFASVLRKYQVVAFNWMVQREEDTFDAEDTSQNDIHPMWDEFRIPSDKQSIFVNHMSGDLQLRKPKPRSECFGGILADEMGLGKTVEMLSVISRDFVGSSFTRVWRVGEDSLKGGTLIVMPLSLIAQWAGEIDRHFNLSKLALSVHHFYSAERSKSIPFLTNTADIVLTTYGTVLSESSNPRSPLFQIVWRRVVLDEAHFIKSRHTRTARAIFSLQAERRWCLTGTPIQNTLDDVFSLFHFLKVEPWGHWSWWTKLTSDPNEAGKRVQTITRGLLLRRTIKTLDPDTHKPILTLPQKTVVAVWLNFTASERDFYKAIFSRAQTEFNNYMAEGLVARNYTSVLQLLLRLRQACCHPILVYSGSASNKNALLGPINSEADVDAAVKQFAKSLAMHCGKTDPETEAFIRRQIKRLAPKASGQTLNQEKGEEAADTCPICLDTPELPVLTHCGHVMCKECAERALSLSNLTSGAPGSNQGTVTVPRQKLKVAPCPVCRTHFSAVTMQSLEVTRQEEKVWPVMLKRLCYSEDGQFNFSIKLRCLDQILQRILPLGYRAVVFSQWVTYLDVIQEMLRWRKISFCRLDGSQSAEKRRQEVASFTSPNLTAYKGPPLRAEDLFDIESGDQSDRKLEVQWTDEESMEEQVCVEGDARVLLASLKAGGVGLNLTSAAYLFLMDSWWNPATEDQAMQRVHRIGQTLPVTIFRFYVRDSIEERILRLHDFKDTQARSVLDAGGGPAASKAWNINELRRLFLG